MRAAVVLSRMPATQAGHRLDLYGPTADLTAVNDTTPVNAAPRRPQRVGLGSFETASFEGPSFGDLTRYVGPFEGPSFEGPSFEQTAATRVITPRRFEYGVVPVGGKDVDRFGNVSATMSEATVFVNSAPLPAVAATLTRPSGFRLTVTEWPDG